MMTSDAPRKNRAGRQLSDEFPVYWKPLVDALGSKYKLAAALGVSYSTLNRWTFADARGKPQEFPLRARTQVQAMAKSLGVKDPTVAPPVCPRCYGKGVRTYTAAEREALGLKPLREGEVPEVFECECQAP